MQLGRACKLLSLHTGSHRNNVYLICTISTCCSYSSVRVECIRRLKWSRLSVRVAALVNASCSRQATMFLHGMLHVPPSNMHIPACSWHWPCAFMGFCMINFKHVLVAQCVLFPKYECLSGLLTPCHSVLLSNGLHFGCLPVGGKDHLLHTAISAILLFAYDVSTPGTLLSVCLIGKGNHSRVESLCYTASTVLQAVMKA